jgi:hypothetical protein
VYFGPEISTAPKPQSYLLGTQARFQQNRHSTLPIKASQELGNSQARPVLLRWSRWEILVANSLCREREKRTMRWPEVKIGKTSGRGEREEGASRCGIGQSWR